MCGLTTSRAYIKALHFLEECTRGKDWRVAPMVVAINPSSPNTTVRRLGVVVDMHRGRILLRLCQPVPVAI